MAFVIGYNSFKVQTLKVSDLITSEKTDHLAHVEVIGRRMYFHIMYIPFFPLWGMWVIGVNGKEALAPVEVLAKLKEKNINVRTPWYAFSGLIISALVGLYFLNSIYNSPKFEEKCEDDVALEEIRWGLLEPMLDKADTANYYFFRDRSWSHNKIARVVSANANEIKYVMFDAPTWISKAEELNPSGEKGYTPDTIEIKRSDLIKLKQTPHDGFFQGSLMLSYSSYPYYLEDIFRVDRPWLTSASTAGDCEYGDYCVGFFNFGTPITIMKIETISGEVDWEGSSITKEIPSGELFYIYGDKTGISHDKQYDFRIICVDRKQKQHSFRIAGIGTDKCIVEE